MLKIKKYEYNFNQGYRVFVEISDNHGENSGIIIKVINTITGKVNYFSATYGVDIFNMPKDHIDLMVWILFFGYGINPNKQTANFRNFDLPPGAIPVNPKLDKGVLLSYSGGADSTAALMLLPSKPIMILKPHNQDYMKFQDKTLAEKLGPEFIVNTDFELIRKKVFNKPEGFNIGIGYISVLIPLLHALKADTISLGVVWDDVAFSYTKELKYVPNHYGRIDFIKNVLLNYGIKLSFPTAGISEVITSNIAEKSGLNYSSCHYTDKKHCGKCYKCLRKLGFQGKKINFNDPQIKNMMYRIINKKPLKMAASTVFGFQSGKYKIEKYDQVDVSFCMRYHEDVIRKYNPPEIAEHLMKTLSDMGINPSNEDDKLAIDEFVKIVNKEEFYE